MTDTWGAAPGQTWLGMLPPTTYTPKCPERAVFLTGVEGPAPGGAGGDPGLLSQLHSHLGKILSTWGSLHSHQGLNLVTS